MGLYIGNNKYKVMIGNQKCSFVTEDSGSILPAGYVQLEYIESTGTQYIDTGITWDDDFSFEVDNISFTPSSATCLFGYRHTDVGTAYGNMRFFFIYGDGRIGIRAGTGNSTNTQRTLTKKSFYRFLWTNKKLYIADKNGVYENWYTIGTLYPTSTYGSIYLCWAEAVGYYYGDLFKLIGTIGNFLIKKNDLVIGFFIPCINPNNEVGMYDVVSQHFFGNSGTGSFIAGPEV